MLHTLRVWCLFACSLRFSQLREGFDLFDRVLLLRAMLPFARTHVGALVQLARHAAELRADAGHELWREGDSPDTALFVVRGGVRARATGRDDVIMGPGYVLGGFDALAQAPRWFTAVADGPLTTLVMPAERFFDVLEDQHELARDLFRDLARAVLRAWSMPLRGTNRTARSEFGLSRTPARAQPWCVSS